MDNKDKSNEKLTSELKGLQIITGALIGIVSLLFIITLYGLLTKDNNKVFIPLMVVAISSGMMIPINFRNMNKIKKEIERREIS